MTGAQAIRFLQRVLQVVDLLEQGNHPIPEFLLGEEGKENERL